MNEKEYFDELRKAQPSWQADGLGVRGNPVELHKEQMQTEFASSNIALRESKIKPPIPPTDGNEVELKRILTSPLAY